MSRKFNFLLLMLLSSVTLTSTFAQPPAKITSTLGSELIMRPYGKVIVFVMDGLSYRHILPHGLSAFGEMGEWLERNGSMALLNTMGYGGNDRFRVAMSIACGVRAFADENAALVLQADEPFEADNALNAYKRRVGTFSLPHAPEPFKPLVFPMLSELKWRNEQIQKKPLPFGIVAQSLLQKGINVIGIGCGDFSTRHSPKASMSTFRHGLLLALDEKGLGVGLTGAKLLQEDPTMPYGLAVEENRWREVFNEAWQGARVIVLFPGETFRVDLYGSQRLIPIAVRRELNLLRPIVEGMDLERDLLILFSLAPSRENRYELSFICVVGKGVERNGLLTSLTTHQVGLVSILDIPATILHFFGVEPLQPINGLPITSVAKGLDKVRLWQMGAKAQVTDTYMRTTILVLWCALQVIFFGLIAFFALQRKSVPALLIEVEVLIAFLTSGIHLVSGLPSSLSPLAAISVAVLVGAAKMLGNGWDRSFLAAVVFADAIFVADATGLMPLSVDSPFGYSTFFGGRYYGQGNVGMGLTLGAIFAITIALNWQRWATAISTFIGAILVGAPFWGANIGGALTGLFITLAVVFAGRVKWWHLLVAILALVLLLFGFAAFELMRPEPLTHWGRLVQSTAKEGVIPFASIVWTKLGIGLRAFKAIHWDIAFFAQGILVAVLWQLRGRDWRLTTLAVGAIAALLLNDSGPQTPVAFMFFPICALCRKLPAHL